jgi:hypothetical protein
MELTRIDLGRYVLSIVENDFGLAADYPSTRG